MGLAHTNDGLLVNSCQRQYSNDPPAALHTFAKDDSMDLLATVPVLTDYERGLMQIAVHQQTQRTYGIVGEPWRNAMVLLDADLQIITTVETVEAEQHWQDMPIRGVAVHGDQVIVLTSQSHPEGSGLRLLDLDGRFLRTIAADLFQNAQAVAASHGRAFVVDYDDGYKDDDDDDGPGLVLHVVDIRSGDILQGVPLAELLGGDSTITILVDGDDIYITDFGTSTVVVLRIAGSEA